MDRRPSLLLAAGTLGSALLALGATGAGALPPSSWDLLRGSAYALPLCVVGIVALCVAWWLLRSAPARVLGQAAVLWGLPLLAAPPLASRDAYAYVGQAALVVAGLDPYAVGPGALPGPLSAGVDEVWIDSPAPYGPLWLGLAGLVVRATGSLVPALLGMRLLAVVGLLLLAWALVRLADVPGRALWLGVANPLVLVHLLAGAHNDALMIGLAAAGLAVATGAGGRPQRLVLAAALVTAGALVKVPAVAVLAFLPLLVARDWPGRVRAGAVVVVAAITTAVGVTLLSGLGWGWLGSLDAGRARLALFSPLTGLGVALPGDVVEPVLAAGLGLAAAVGLALLLAADRLGPVRACGLLLLAVSLLLPVVQPWYVLWGVVLLGATSSARVVAGLGAACVVLVLLVQPSGRSVVRPPLYGVPVLLAAAVGACVWRGGRAERSDVEQDGETCTPPRRPEPT